MLRRRPEYKAIFSQKNPVWKKKDKLDTKGIDKELLFEVYSKLFEIEEAEANQIDRLEEEYKELFA